MSARRRPAERVCFIRTVALAVALALSAGLARADGPACSDPSKCATPSSSSPDDPPTPVVALRVRVPASAAPGQDVQYQLHVENTSTAAAHHVLVRAPLPANARFVRAEPEPAAREPELLWRLGTLEGGARKEIVLVLTPTGTDDVVFCARIQFEHGQCVTTRVARSPAGGLSLRKTGPTQAVVGEALTFQFVVTNNGTAELTNVTLTDLLPDGLEHASGSNFLTWNVGTLAPGQHRVAEYRVTAKAAGKLCDKAVATASGGVREELESCITVVEAKVALTMTGLLFEVVDTGDPVEIGGTTSYVITVRNQGQVPANNVRVRATVPVQMELVRAEGPANYRADGAAVLFEPVTVRPGAEVRYQIDVKALRAGDARFKAELTSDALTSGRPVVEEESTTIIPDLPVSRRKNTWLARPAPASGERTGK